MTPESREEPLSPFAEGLRAAASLPPMTESARGRVTGIISARMAADERREAEQKDVA